MASESAALYCFEILNASLSHQLPRSLAQVEDSYDQYLAHQNAGEAKRNLDEDAAAGLSEVDNAYERSEEDGNISDMIDTSITNSRHQRSSQYGGPDRLAALSPSTGSSTPSSSSNASLLSIPSSRSSLSSTLTDLRNKSQRRTPEHSHPMFITWNTINSSGSKSLRGCIGTFEAQPVEQGLKSYALTSAFDDTRFQPVSKRELPSLECSVTFLTDFEPAPSPMAWDIGIHGLRISFTSHSKRYGATYLPDVAREQGWTKTETMVSLMRKAGWSGRRDEWMTVQDLNVVRYQGQKVDVRHDEWRAWRDWADAQDKGVVN